jgi:hypothetical protein
MPVPVILAVVALVEEIVAASAVIATAWAAFELRAEIARRIEEFLRSDQVKAIITGHVNDIIVDYARQQLAIELDPADPLTKQSISHAIGARLGFTITDITDKEALMTDVSKELAKRINGVAGTNFTKFYPVDTIKQQLQNECFVAFEKTLNAQPSWLAEGIVQQIIQSVKAHDGVFVNRTTKKDRARYLARLRQKQYAMTHRRVSEWVPR